MFSRNISSQYKSFSKSLQSLTIKVSPSSNNNTREHCKEIFNKLKSVTNQTRYSEFLHHSKKTLINGCCRERIENVLSPAYNNLSQKFAKYTSAQNKTEKENDVNRMLHKLMKTNKHQELNKKPIQNVLEKQLNSLINLNHVFKEHTSAKLKTKAKEKLNTSIIDKLRHINLQTKNILLEKRETISSNVSKKPVLFCGGITVANTQAHNLENQETAGALDTTHILNTGGTDTSTFVEAIPEPPPVPDPTIEALSQINALGEPTLTSLGLGGWSPTGIVQSCLEYFHVTLGIPWWEAIVIGTIIVRLLMFPLVILTQRNAAKMNNCLPQLQVLQLKMTEARQTGNNLDAARYSQEMMLFMKEKGVNPVKNMIVPLAQMPLFISFFIGLRKMANVPVESLRDGGMLWFTDLTVPDQYFALPVITTLTLWATIELGTDSARLSAQNLQLMKYVLRALPFMILPFTVNFPGAILCYWVSSNFISLGQVGFLKIPAVRTYFKIDAIITHKPENLPIKSKGFVGGIKDTWTNMKLTRELEDRRRYDELQFRRAGKGPIAKTYKQDPTKQANNPNAVSAKER